MRFTLGLTSVRPCKLPIHAAPQKIASDLLFSYCFSSPPQVPTLLQRFMAGPKEASAITNLRRGGALGSSYSASSVCDRAPSQIPHGGVGSLHVSLCTFLACWTVNPGPWERPAHGCSPASGSKAGGERLLKRQSSHWEAPWSPAAAGVPPSAEAKAGWSADPTKAGNSIVSGRVSSSPPAGEV